jgi:hypothetical protein
LGFLRQKGVVEDAPPFDEAGLAGPYYVQEEYLEPSGQHFGQDFVQTSEQSDWAPISDLGMLLGLGDQGYEPFVNHL